MDERRAALSRRQATVKRAVDLAVSIVLLAITGPVLALAWLAAAMSTRASGTFRQARVGIHGDTFEVLKLRTMVAGPATTTVTTSGDARITRTGAVLRRFKLDELPQLINVIRGEMSLVGPRPDVPGYADLLEGEERLVLGIRPGITGPASLAFRHEEELLATVNDPETYNRDVIWPEKVRINREYVENWTLMSDVRCLLDTAASIVAGRNEKVDV